MFLVKRSQWVSPTFQVALLGVVFFCYSGMLKALLGMGAAGGSIQDANTLSKGTLVLYSILTLTGLWAGGAQNLLGPKLSLSVGGVGYLVYLASLLHFKIQRMGWVVILGGGISGLGASLVWAAQGSILVRVITPSFLMNKLRRR